MFATIRALFAKDVRLFLRDRTALFFALLLPVGLAAVMGTALGGQMGGGGGGGVQRIGLAVEDQDQSETSRALIAALEAAGGLKVEIAEDARRLVADGDRAAGLVIPSGYGEGAARGALEDLRLYRDPARQIASQVVVFQLAPVLMGRMTETLGSGVMGRVLDTIEFPAAGRAAAEAALQRSFEEIDTITADLAADDVTSGASDEAGGTVDDAETDDTSGFDMMSFAPKLLGLAVEDLAPERADGLPRSAGASHAFAAMAVMMLLFNLVAAAGTLQDERAEGTLDRLRLTPHAGSTVLLGKLCFTMAMGLAQLAVLFTFGALVFDVPVLEHLPELVATSLVWAFTGSGLGLVFATACRTRKQMEGLSTLVILGMSAVGGAWFPREITPEWFQTAGLATPVAWAMDAYHGILWYGKGLVASPERSGVIVQLGVLLGFGAVMLAASTALYRSRFGSR